MKELHAGFAAASWPAPADHVQLELERSRWTEAVGELDDPALQASARALNESPEGQAVFAAVFGNSPYLSRVMVEDPAFALDLLATGPEIAHRVLTDLRAGMTADTDEGTLMTALRRAKRRAALAIALADIAGLWPVEQITGSLSDLADTAVALTVRHLLRRAAAAGSIRLRDPAEPDRDCGYIVLGLGKLGARELNYSSDIDLIVLYDPERVQTDDPENLQQLFVRMTRNLVKILEERRPEGYVFRTDLRLRPDPGSTPLALSVLAAETYYESLGQNWERAAMIKARPIAGDLAAGSTFIGRLRPYVWRKHLDFAAIQDIHSIKRQVNAYHGGSKIGLAGHNIKLGRGGIREVEFFAQTQQLIWGGRFPELRLPQTCPAIEALTRAGRVTPEAAQDMLAAYRFLRRVEHRLQMTEDKQTHTLPEAGPQLDALAVFLGYPDLAAFRRELFEHMTRVERHYAALFEEAPALGGPGNLVFTGAEDDPSTLETLTKLGFKDPSRVAATVRGWHHGRYRAMRSVRARELLTELMPGLLEALGRTAQPDSAFLRFDHFLSQLPAGVQLFSLFHSNPNLLTLVAEIMGDAPRLADLLSRHTNLLDSVLSTDFLAAPPDGERLRADLDQALDVVLDFQDILDVLRRWRGEREFQVGVQMLHGFIDARYAGGALSDIAETTLATLQPAVEAEFARAHGRVPGGAFAVVAFGKLGGREMTVTSDLDLIFLWDAPEDVETSDGAKPLPVSLYYQRLAQRFINAITAPTGEGKLYELDLRLRPSGNKGPLATNLDGFIAYQAKDAWTWEHLALTRARPITGPAAFRERIAATIRDVLVRPRDLAKLTRDVAEMRALMAREHPAKQPWDIKHWRGGLIDVEFIAQYLQLRHAAKHPEMLATNTALALQRALDIGVLAEADGQVLLDALRLWQAVQGLLRLSLEGDFDPTDSPPGLKQALARAALAVDFAALEANMLDRSARALAVFESLIPPVAAS
jgi:[glutamine synthetase] adenylyltransferase / [glutamine synthetase]-adenylyl-L-tyrosine phosphorylase